MKKQISVIDDHIMMQCPLRNMLSKKYEVSCAAWGNSLLVLKPFEAQELMQLVSRPSDAKMFL
jgi:hypothetical protein